jgi:hypothetical protein
MHWNLDLILWALVLAAHLILLVTLMGRDRIKRFPWFTASIVLAAVRLIADHLLSGKLATVAFYWQSYVTLLLGAIVGLLVLIELARKVFAKGDAGICLNAKGWLGWTFVTVGVAGLAAWRWNPWPAWHDLQAQPATLWLTLTGLAGTKMLTNAIGYLAVDRIQNFIIESFKANARTPGHHVTQQEYEHAVHLLGHLSSVVVTVWLLVLIWWIFSLWRDEPGSPTNLAALFEAPAVQTEIAAEEGDGDLDFRD